MPIFEYRCRGCGHLFEEVVLPSSTPSCPSCQSQDLEKQMSLFAVKSETTRKANLASGKKEAKLAKRDEIHAQREYFEKHQH